MNDSIAPYEIGLYEDLTDPDEAAAYLNAALEDGDQEVFLLALRHVAEARGISQVARQARLNRESLYRMLSSAGNSQLASLNALLRTVGLRLAVEIEQRRPIGVGVAETQAAYEAER